MLKNNTLYVNKFTIQLKTINHNDYFSLSDLAKYKSTNSKDVIRNWMKNMSTLEFLTTWEQLNNPNFKHIESHTPKGISPTKWIELTGIESKLGRYGGIYAHKDIAFEFLTWLSPKWKLYVIREFQRLKKDEKAQKGNAEWEFHRILSKRNYHLQTSAVQQYILPNSPFDKKNIEYALEADLLNKAVFHLKAKEFRKQNQNPNQNLRDIASMNQLLVLTNP